MGWMADENGDLSGDGPANAIGDGFRDLVQEAQRRIGTCPSGEAVLNAFVHALNLDGSRAPFYSEHRRIRALLVHHGERQVRVDGNNAELWLVADFYPMLEMVAEEYLEVWNRPPHLSELIRYIAFHLEDEEGFRRCISDGMPWSLRDARFVFRKERKPEDRTAPPAMEAAPTAARGRVVHAKFGEGIVLHEDGDRLTVQFGADRRVVLRSFVNPVS